MSASEPGNGRREEASARRSYVEPGLAVLGLEGGSDEIAIIEAVEAIYGPGLEALLAAGLDHVPHEPGADMSRPARTADER